MEERGEGPRTMHILRMFDAIELLLGPRDYNSYVSNKEELRYAHTGNNERPHRYFLNARNN